MTLDAAQIAELVAAGDIDAAMDALAYEEAHAAHEVWADGPPPSSPLHPDQMPMGYPRPVSVHPPGLPVPYIAMDPEQMGEVESMRRALCVLDHRCQVCGLPLGDTAVVVARLDHAVVTDGAAIHPDRCWPLARRLCPHLREEARNEELMMWEVPTADLREYPGGHGGVPAFATPPRELGRWVR